MAADKEAAMSVLNISQIMEILPHRQPMLLIDSVEEIEYGVRAVAKKSLEKMKTVEKQLILRPSILQNLKEK